MFDNNVTVSDGTDNHTYGLTEVGTRKSTRSETAAPLDVPANLRISHESVGSGINLRQRSLVAFDRVVEDGNGEQGVIKCQLVLDIPVKVAESTEVTKTSKELLNFLTASTYANLAKVIAGEI